MKKSWVETPLAPKPIGPYGQAVRAGDWLFLSGQIPINPATGQLTAGSIAEATEQVIANLSAVLQAAGGSLENVVKVTIFLADLNDFAAVNAVYSRYFEKSKPARSTVEAKLPKGAPIEMDAIAFLA